MTSFKPSAARALLLGICLFAPVALTACGGGDTSVVAQSKRLVGKVYAKLIGDKIGQLKAEVKALSDTTYLMTGTLDIDGTTFDINGTVGPDNNFSVTFSNTSGPGDGATVLADGRYTGKLAEPLAATPDTLTVANGVWTANLPTAGGLSGATTPYKGTSDPTAADTTTGGSALPASACEWNASAFYNPQQVVSYLGQFYTASEYVVPFGSVGAALFNPAASSTSWIRGGSCGPTPFVRVATAVCKVGTNGYEITMTGTAYGGGIGDAIAAYTNVTDRSFSNENEFGLPGTSYRMTCTGGGFSGTFASATSPAYSLCVKTTASNSATTWTSSQTVPYSTNTNKFTTAYASKGNPLRDAGGGIILMFDRVRSDGVAITGNCL